MQTIIQGDCLEEMRKMADNSIDFIVTDSPYGIAFMGKEWDQKIPPIEYWQEMLRICKPGSMMACAGLPRMYHRLACVVEDAGWKIKDCILHLFGSGFPKAMNFGKKLGGQWEGYSSCGLKPAYEPWLICEKPIEKTYIQNAEKWGVAGLNIDASRIGSEEIKTCAKEKGSSFTHLGNGEGYNGCSESFHRGRWPANLILDEEAAQQLDEMTGNNVSRFFYCAKASSSERNKGLDGMPLKECKTGCGGAMPIDDNGKERDRFKKVAHNTHPTVKPLALMEYLLKLVMPPNPNATCLDPFAGSGSTLVAAKELGINCIGIEKESEYCEIARKRVNNNLKYLL